VAPPTQGQQARPILGRGAAAHVHVVNEFTLRLGYHTQPALLPFRREAAIIPTTGHLLGVLYGLFALEVRGSIRRPQTRRNCGKTIIAKRRGKVYCDSGCKENYFYHHCERSPKNNPAKKRTTKQPTGRGTANG
jgi:hypothetical protein